MKLCNNRSRNVRSFSRSIAGVISGLLWGDMRGVRLAGRQSGYSRIRRMAVGARTPSRLTPYVIYAKTKQFQYTGGFAASDLNLKSSDREWTCVLVTLNCDCEFYCGLFECERVLRWVSILRYADLVIKYE